MGLWHGMGAIEYDDMGFEIWGTGSRIARDDMR